MALAPGAQFDPYQIALVTESGTRTMLTHVRGYHTGNSLSIAADNTWHSYTETSTEVDVWIAIVRR